jgi:hypothetical protein
LTPELSLPQRKAWWLGDGDERTYPRKDHWCHYQAKATAKQFVKEITMAQVESLLVFLASPGDVAKERRYVHQEIDELNRTIASARGLVLQVVSWENNAFPGYGMDAQARLNAQIAEMAKYSLFVGIMWNRLGTPTPRAESGTVEEFERAVAAFAQCGQSTIWFYFREAPAKLDTDEELEQRKKVLAFKKRVQANGMPWSYKIPSDFRSKFRNQMILWLNSVANQAQTSYADSIRVRVHRAYFLHKPEEPCFFVNVVNSSQTSDIEITHVWYEGSTRVDVLEARRPLPRRLRPNESWETWIRSANLPSDPNPCTNFRVRISTGEVFNSEKNRDVPPRGFVPGR